MLKELKSGIPKLFYSRKRRTYAGEGLTRQEKITFCIIIYILSFTILLTVGIYLLG